jgi:hypothetical protein
MNLASGIVDSGFTFTPMFSGISHKMRRKIKRTKWPKVALRLRDTVKGMPNEARAYSRELLVSVKGV